MMRGEIKAKLKLLCYLYGRPPRAIHWGVLVQRKSPLVSMPSGHSWSLSFSPLSTALLLPLCQSTLRILCVSRTANRTVWWSIVSSSTVDVLVHGRRTGASERVVRVILPTNVRLFSFVLLFPIFPHQCKVNRAQTLTLVQGRSLFPNLEPTDRYRDTFPPCTIEHATFLTFDDIGSDPKMEQAFEHDNNAIRFLRLEQFHLPLVTWGEIRQACWL